MARSTIKERCHIKTNIDKDTFVGIKCVNGDISVSFPIGYKTEKDDYLLRKDILLLINVLAHNTDKKDSEINKSISYSHVTEPVQSYLYIISDFYARGYYGEQDIVYKISKQGKTNWKRTFKTQKALIQGEDTYYLDFVTTKKTFSDNELITLIHEFCVYESFYKLGWLFSSFMPKKPRISYHKKLFISVIKRKLNATFRDKDKKLFINMLAIVSSLGDNGATTDYMYGTTRFEYVWEAMIDKAFGESNKKDYYPRTTWLLPDENYNNPPLRPDTIMRYNNKIYVLDSKYYRFGQTKMSADLPDATSISKQITYGEYIAESAKFLLKDGTHPIVYNAFLMPYDADGKLFFTKKQFSYIGTAISNWKSSDGTKPYEQILGILVDTKTLMKDYSKDNERIYNLAKLIESHLRL